MLLYHLYVETHFNHTMPGLRNSATPSSQCSPTKFDFVFNTCHQAEYWKQRLIWSRHRTLFSWSAGQTCALPEVARKRPKVWIMSYSKIVFHFSGGLAQRDSPTRYTHEESSKSLTNQFFQAKTRNKCTQKNYLAFGLSSDRWIVERPASYCSLRCSVS
jgi:hypothetical protein